jgi:hypothetical protein
VTRFTWYRLGQDMWGAEPSGRHRAILRDAIDNLMGAVVTLSGFNAHTGEPTPALFSDVHLPRSVVRPRPRGTEVDPVLEGATREETVEVRLEDWIVAQLLGDYRLVLDWQVQRQLTGVPKRLWYYLGARAGDFTEHVWPDEAEFEIELSDTLMEGLSLTAARPRARRATIARAGTRIVYVDPRYVRIDVERATNTAGGYQLRAVRRERPADELAAVSVLVCGPTRGHGQREQQLAMGGDTHSVPELGARALGQARSTRASA